MLQKSIEFMNMTKVIKHLSTVEQDIVTSKHLGCNPILDRDEIATLPKKKSNKCFKSTLIMIGDIIHYNLVHSNGIAIGGVKYVFFLSTKHPNTYLSTDSKH